jgi:hypothetical protein
MARLRSVVALLTLGLAFAGHAQTGQLPGPAPPAAGYLIASISVPDFLTSNFPAAFTGADDPYDASAASPLLDSPTADSLAGPQSGPSPDPAAAPASRPRPAPNVPVDAAGNPIPLERQQPQRILGFMPNFRSVSGGAKPHPPDWKYNFTVATHQATDYSTFIFLGLTSITAEGMNMHPALGKGADGFYAYAWRGFLDKTDGTYLSAWLLPSTLHEDTRFYALGEGHSILIRSLYVISRQGVARTYGGHDTPNFAGLGGKVLTQVVSRTYYPSSATSFSVLASKFGYSVMRDVIFSSIREFYPDAAAHFIRRHQAKVAVRDAADRPVQADESGQSIESVQ